MKKLAKIVVIVTALCLSLMLLTACGKDLFVSKNLGIKTFKMDDDFKILHLTDIHYGEMGQAGKDALILENLPKILNEADADLVILTGDVITNSLYPADDLKRIAQIFEDKKVYWAIIFGNHDGEKNFRGTTQVQTQFKKDFPAVLAEFKYSLFEKGPEMAGMTVDGKKYAPTMDNVGNYVINIVNNKNKLVQSLYLMDTNMGITVVQDGIPNYSPINYEPLLPSQIEWYESQVNAIKKANKGVVVPSMLFIHIPLNEYQEAWEYSQKNPSALIGGVKLDNFAAPEVNTGMFAKIKELGSTNAIYAGHEHRNNFMVKYQDIMFIMGQNFHSGGSYTAAPSGNITGRMTILDKNGNVTYKYVVAEDGMSAEIK